jgi:hypothetical protein
MAARPPATRAQAGSFEYQEESRRYEGNNNLPIAL